MNAGSAHPAPGTPDHEYNTRLWAPGFEDTLQTHRLWGEQARRMPGAQLDLRWGPRPRQTLDWFAPAADSGPLLVFIHGGYWQYRTSGKDSVSFLAPHYVDRGAAFAAVQYELCPDVTMDEMVAQIRQALLWIVGHARGLGWHARRITVGGHSAGGHLAAMMALTRWQEYGADPDLVAAACCVSGLYELGPLVPTYVNAALRMDEEVATRVSPQRALRPGAPPLVLAVGDQESGEFKRQTRDFAAQASVQGIPVEAHVVPDRNHYDVVRALIDPASPLGLATQRIVFADTGSA
jgi:arylformamidase